MNTPILDALLKEIELLKGGQTSTPLSEIVVSNPVELQTALDSSATRILVRPGTYSGNFILKPKSTNTVVIGTDFEGRAKPNYIFPTLHAKDKFISTLQILPNSHDYSFNGIEFTGVALDRNVIECGVGAVTAQELPRNITFNKCWIHGTDAPFGHRGIYFDAINGIITSCLFSDFVEQGRDSNAIGIFQGGPYLIENNQFEASGEGILIGGVDPKIPGMIPNNIIIKNNTFFKPLAWKPVYTDGKLTSGYPGSVKNMFELKNAEKVTISNNIFENVWIDAQSGSGIVFTVRNQDGAAPWSNIRDVLFINNIVKNVPGSSINILATDNNHPSGLMERVYVRNNLFLNCANGIQIGDGGANLEFTNNVFLGIKGKFLSFYGKPLTAFKFNKNFAAPGEYGIAGDSTTLGTPSLEKFAPGYEFLGNTIEVSPARPINYPIGNLIVPSGTIKETDWKLL